jgi:AcrR family transcriptional regulator
MNACTLPAVPKPAARRHRAPSRPARRTQAERRAATRERLLDAAVAGLVEVGFAGTTTTEVCRRAGASQGALFKHFATKAELVAAAAEHLFSDLIEAFETALPSVAGAADAPAAAVRQLWSVFHQPRLHAAFELYNAARTDAELARSLAPISARHAANVRAHARSLFPEAAARRPDFDAVVGVVVSAMQGAAFGDFRGSDPTRDAPLLAALSDLVRRSVATP